MSMLFTDEEKRLAQAIGNLNYTNPFVPERLECEQAILGSRSRSNFMVWHNRNGERTVNRNINPIAEVCGELVHRLWSRLAAMDDLPSADEMQVFDQLLVYWLFEKYRVPMCEMILEHPSETNYPCYKEYLEDFNNAVMAAHRRQPSDFQPEKTFAIFHQIHRAFYYIFNFIAGGSLAAGQLRANIWQSIFTYDIARYHRLLFDRMNNVTTLVTGESGTGKELVSRAIAFSQYIPFDGRKSSFAQSYEDSFKALQLSAMPQTMVESELFGHVKGAFTGAVADHHGYLETCSPHDSIFLDEIGDIVPEVQIKLLRVLQTRTFQRVGDVHPLVFKGKIIAATNQDLLKASQEGRFRSDLYYRLCSDTISTVPLRQMINGSAEELRQFIMVLALRILGNVKEAGEFADEACEWIVGHLGMSYGWPGNVRELEQCLRNLLIRGEYQPPQRQRVAQGSRAEMLRGSHLTADQLLREYLGVVYEREGRNLAKTAVAVQLDRRTVRKYLD